LLTYEVTEDAMKNMTGLALADAVCKNYIDIQRKCIPLFVRDDTLCARIQDPREKLGSSTSRTRLDVTVPVICFALNFKNLSSAQIQAAFSWESQRKLPHYQRLVFERAGKKI